jgi:hypothetical protein
MSYSGIRGLVRQALPIALAFLLAVTQTQAAGQAAVPQQGPAAQAPAKPAPLTATPPAATQPLAQLPVEQSLKILVLAGRGEMNDLERKVMAPLVVQVLDRNDRPVEGADVVFRFPIDGPGAVFSGGKTSATVQSNATGQAAAVNWMANGVVGRFDVHVTASYGNQIGETTLTMTNVTKVVEEKPKSKPASWWSHRWVKIAVIGGAAAIVAGVVLATRGGSKSSGSTVTIIPGSPTVGAP